MLHYKITEAFFKMYPKGDIERAEFLLNKDKFTRDNFTHCYAHPMDKYTPLGIALQKAINENWGKK